MGADLMMTMRDDVSVGVIHLMSGLRRFIKSNLLNVWVWQVGARKQNGQRVGPCGGSHEAISHQTGRFMKEDVGWGGLPSPIHSQR